MTQVLSKLALLTLATLAVPAAASAGAPFEGRWANPKRSVIIEVAPCGPAYCGTVVWASAKAKENAREGGTRNLIGTRLIEGIRPDGNGGFKGRGFVPKQNIHASATIRKAGPDVMVVKGCALGVICKEQRWTKVN
jgi:uncharacterized protein (DUF2147 family)